MNFRVKTFSGAKPCVFRRVVAPGVARIGSVFPQLRPSMSTKSTQDCSESSVCSSKRVHGALLEGEVGQTCTGLLRELDYSKNDEKKLTCRAEQVRHGIDLARCACYAGLQPAATKRAGKEYRCCHATAMRDCNWRLQDTLYLGCRRCSWKAAQGRSGSLLREELADRRRRGRSMKK